MRSLLGRSVLAAVVGILVAILAAGVGVDLLVARDLRSSLDRSLRRRAIEIAQLSASAPALLTRGGALDTTVSGTQISVEVLDRRGRLVVRSLDLGGRLLPVSSVARTVIATGRPAWATTSDGDTRRRIYAAPLADFGGPAAGGAVVVAAAQADLEHTLGDLRLFLFLGGLGAAAAGALAVFVLMRRALRPVAELARAAGEVERTGDPRRRLPVPPTDDEVGRLAVTLNDMLGSLDRARERERRFLADASHELRTPITALRGNIAYLAEHGATPEVLRDVEHDAERLARLADDLLVLSREEASATPDGTVRLDELARATAAGHAGVVAEAPEPVLVRGNADSLARALENLVRNAEVHGPADGRITVRAARLGECARLTVEDEGTGLRAEEQKLAFQRFWRRDQTVPGSGLGLAIVAATAARHGGRAYADGPRFTIELPVLRDLSKNSGTTDGDPEKGSP